LFYYSHDGGDSWTQGPQLANVAEITDMSFLSSGVGFATAMTIYDDSTVLRYTPGGPPGPTPTSPPGPTQPPGPTPTQPAGTFTQKVCTDAACSQGCQSNSFPTGQCLQTNEGNSAIVTCSSTELLETIYLLSTNCTGISLPSSMPLNQCLQLQGGQGYVENTCSSNSTTTQGSKLWHSMKVNRKILSWERLLKKGL